MHLPALLAAVSLAWTVFASAALAASAATDWPAFLSRHEFQWETPPARWEESAFIGNGNVGATIHLREKKLSWEINRTDLYVRDERIRFGHLSLETEGAVTGGDMRLSLWDAEARGTLLTDRGEVRWRSVALREPGLLLIEVEGRSGEPAPSVSWHPAEARPAAKTYIHRRKHRFAPDAPPPDYQPEDLHPPAETAATADGFTGSQTYLGGGAAAIIARAHPSAASGKRVFLVALELAPTAGEARAKADAALKTASRTGPDRLLAAHRDWWRAYYPQSFVSLPGDPRVEAFYWRQIYKFGSAMRSDGPFLDVLGPWFREVGWPAIYWNMNVQLIYHPLASSNRLELAESLYRNLDRHREQLIDNVVPSRPARDAAGLARATGQNLRKKIELGMDRTDDRFSWAREPGNLAWVMYLYWEFYRYRMDDAILRDRVFPLLALSTGLYLTHLETGADGVIHLKPTYSPELALVSDSNYDLALFRWSLQTLVASCERLKIDDTRLPRWQDVLSRLAPLPVDETGLMIGRGLPLATSHRHASHLLAIHPLRLLDPDNSGERALAERSIAHWLAQPGDRLSGFSHTSAASLHAALGHGDKALWHINHLFDGAGVAYIWKLHPNTLYTEGGGPVIETPLSVVSAVNEMLLQSWGGVLRVFPAAPSAWKNATFTDLRAEGAFLVGAERREGRVARVEIHSLAGEPCRVRVPGWTADKIRVVRHEGQPTPPRLAALPNGDLQIDLAKNARVVLAPAP